MILPAALVAQLALSCAPEAAPGTLAAVAAAESGFDPLAIYDNTTGESWRPSSVSMAFRKISNLSSSRSGGCRRAATSGESGS